MFELHEAMIHIRKDEYLRSDRRFSFDEEGLFREKIKFEHRKDQDRIKMELDRKDMESKCYGPYSPAYTCRMPIRTLGLRLVGTLVKP
jgi:hypothetical protein